MIEDYIFFCTPIVSHCSVCKPCRWTKIPFRILFKCSVGSKFISDKWGLMKSNKNLHSFSAWSTAVREWRYSLWSSKSGSYLVASMNSLACSLLLSKAASSSGTMPNSGKQLETVKLRVCQNILQLSSHPIHFYLTVPSIQENSMPALLKNLFYVFMYVNVMLIQSIKWCHDITAYMLYIKFVKIISVVVIRPKFLAYTMTRFLEGSRRLVSFFDDWLNSLAWSSSFFSDLKFGLFCHSTFHGLLPLPLFCNKIHLLKTLFPTSSKQVVPSITTRKFHWCLLDYWSHI